MINYVESILPPPPPSPLISQGKQKLYGFKVFNSKPSIQQFDILLKLTKLVYITMFDYCLKTFLVNISK